MRGIPRALGCSAYLSVWRDVGALCVEHLVVFVPSLPTLCFPLCISVTGACFFRGRGGSWLGCQVLPAIGAVSILELAVNSGSSRMSRAPNLQRATKLFTEIESFPIPHFSTVIKIYYDAVTAKERKACHVLPYIIFIIIIIIIVPECACYYFILFSLLNSWFQ